MAQPKTAREFILRGLFLPLSHENVLLTYKPSQFFYELSRVSHYSEKTLRTSMSRARKDGLIILEDKIPKLTEKGMKKARPFVAKKLGKNARLLVAFDIPESRTAMRQEFRTLLKQLDFTYVQQSVWVTEYDHRKILREALEELELEDCVVVYEAAQLHP